MKNSTKLNAEDFDSKLLVKITSLLFNSFDGIHEIEEIPFLVSSGLCEIFEPDYFELEKKEMDSDLPEIVWEYKSSSYENQDILKMHPVCASLFKTLDGREFFFKFYYLEEKHYKKVQSIFDNSHFLNWMQSIFQYLYGLLSFFEELQKIRIFFQNIIDTLPELLIVFNKDNYISEWRDSSNLTGFSQGSMNGRSFSEVIKGIDIEILKEQLKEQEKEHHLPIIRDIDGFLLSASNQVKEVKLNLSYFKDENKGFEYYIVLGEDVSEKKELERQIHERNKKLEVFYSNYSKEVHFASVLQKKMMKNETKDVFDFRVSTFYLPFEHVGGDYVGVLPIGNKLYFLAADVVGHGIFSAIYSSMMHSSFYNLVFHPETIESFMLHVHKEFCELMGYESFLSVVCGHIDAEKKEIVFANYGHPYPAFFKSDTNDAIFLDGVHNKIISPLIDFEEPKLIRVNYNPGDKLIIYSDGLIEENKESSRKFGDFLENIRQTKDLNGKEFVNSLIATQAELTGLTHPHINNFKTVDFMNMRTPLHLFNDDLSLIVFEF